MSLSEGQSSEAEPFVCGAERCLQVDSVRTELNSWTELVSLNCSSVWGSIHTCTGTRSWNPFQLTATSVSLEAGPPRAEPPAGYSLMRTSLKVSGHNYPAKLLLCARPTDTARSANFWGTKCNFCFTKFWSDLSRSTEQCKTPKDKGTDPIWAEDCSKKSKTKELSEKLHKAQKLLPEDIIIHSVFKNKRSP